MSRRCGRSRLDPVLRVPAHAGRCRRVSACRCSPRRVRPHRADDHRRARSVQQRPHHATGQPVLAVQITLQLIQPHHRPQQRASRQRGDLGPARPGVPATSPVVLRLNGYPGSGLSFAVAGELETIPAPLPTSPSRPALPPAGAEPRTVGWSRTETALPATPGHFRRPGEAPLQAGRSTPVPWLF